MPVSMTGGLRARKINIDAGWYDGYGFRIVVLDPDWDLERASCTTPDLDEFVATLEAWMWVITQRGNSPSRESVLRRIYRANVVYALTALAPHFAGHCFRSVASGFKASVAGSVGTVEEVGAVIIISFSGSDTAEKPARA
ncbi:hypothetical protein [Streptomyces acidicola]|uniref:hypothetical protein n=1 Tax=Streptomyces acidicola TaxID=2596892 RepID=UPI00343B370B